MKITNDDLRWVKEQFPELTHRLKGTTHIFSGALCFKGVFNHEKDSYTFNTSSATISDAYEVKIELPETGTPSIYETGTRIPVGADSHKYSDGRICAWGPLDEPKESESVRSIFNRTCQFFFDQTYHALFKEWPRGEFYHGAEGVLQNYHKLLLEGFDRAKDCLMVLRRSDEGRKYIAKVISRKQVKGHHRCQCKLGDCARRCHPDAFWGLWSLQRYCWKNDVQS